MNISIQAIKQMAQEGKTVADLQELEEKALELPENQTQVKAQINQEQPITAEELVDEVLENGR